MSSRKKCESVTSSVGNPDLDPQNSHVFGPLGSGSIMSGSGSFTFPKNVLS